MSADAERPPRRKLNLGQRRALKAAEIQTFVTKYARKAPKSGEPNDRRFDTDVARKVGAMRAEDLDRLMRDDED